MLVVDKPKYNMAIYEAKKEVHVQVHGFIKTELVEEYIKDLEETVAKVPKKSYTFVVDATYQSPVPSKVSAELGQTLMFYASLGFKDIYIVNPASKIAYVQVRNALEGVNFPGTVVDNVSQLATR
ncbi:hypothetical protein FCT18_10155 [Lysinibacillus sphaericus]|uniref:Uncharacterized protein n=2 Tax=Lysinibacillus TaxID=400634 RepID=A0A2S0JW94_LYSSH|nr:MULTISPECIES: hypothetical protein [Lysinibacillus]AVK95366.1 hypothetical protein LS41612_03260 [Lysinibacillus sphaericus]MCS1384293.1 hypothetical protein [Lysinibacillus sphaericus]MED4546257.1 hypothetical protein [Lysinibacillus sphaericus]TKI19379.1 hypothetical protein FCT18_10155 [Lysinibacillus sphaericus]TKI45648.1 hypothetical protein FC748_18690 [Lysinibacillus tabacifolii]